MLKMPRQDWSLYESTARDDEMAWVRALTPSDRFLLYEDFFKGVRNVQRDAGSWARLETWHWNQKLPLRIRLLHAFEKLDDMRRGRTA